MKIIFVCVLGLLCGATANERCKNLHNPNDWNIYQRLHDIKVLLCQEINSRPQYVNEYLCDKKSPSHKDINRCRDLYKKVSSNSKEIGVKNITTICYDSDWPRTRFTWFTTRADKISNNIFLPQEVRAKYSDGQFGGGQFAYTWETSEMTSYMNTSNCDSFLFIDTSPFSKYIVENSNYSYLILNNNTYSLKFKNKSPTSSTKCGVEIWETDNPDIFIAKGVISKSSSKTNLSDAFLGQLTKLELLDDCNSKNPTSNKHSGEPPTTEKVSPTEDGLPEIEQPNQTKPDKHLSITKHTINETNSSKASTETVLSLTEDRFIKIETKLTLISYALAAILCYITLHATISLYNVWKNCLTFRNYGSLCQANINRFMLQKVDASKVQDISGNKVGNNGPNVKAVENNYEYVPWDYIVNDLYVKS